MVGCSHSPEESGGAMRRDRHRPPIGKVWWAAEEPTRSKHSPKDTEENLTSQKPREELKEDTKYFLEGQSDKVKQLTMDLAKKRTLTNKVRDGCLELWGMEARSKLSSPGIS